MKSAQIIKEMKNGSLCTGKDYFRNPKYTNVLKRKYFKCLGLWCTEILLFKHIYKMKMKAVVSY